MTECINTEVRDALPDLVHGRLSALDTATMKAHVESCAACRAEVALLREVISTARLAPSIDVARIAAAIQPAAVHAMPAAPRRPRSGIRVAALSLGAAALVVIGSLALGRTDASVTRAPAAAVADLPAIDGVTATATPVQPAAPGAQALEPAITLTSDIESLTDAELETLIAEVDGMDVLPSDEPLPLSLDDYTMDTSGLDG